MQWLGEGVFRETTMPETGVLGVVKTAASQTDGGTVQESQACMPVLGIILGPWSDSGDRDPSHLNLALFTQHTYLQRTPSIAQALC